MKEIIALNPIGMGFFCARAVLACRGKPCSMALGNGVTMKPLQFRTAAIEDAGAIAQLVNEAYRPESGARGWTHEAKLVAGNRTHADQVQALIAKKNSVILLGLDDQAMVACVHIEKAGSDTHIGMLAVRPNLQGTGAGKNMLAYAEDYATRHFRAEKFVMVVVSSRKELLAFYLRRGYQQTGIVMAYPLDAEAGVPKRADLEIEVLHKASDLNPDCPLECSCMQEHRPGANATANRGRLPSPS